MLTGLIGDGHLSAICVDNYVIEGVNCAHSSVCFVKAKVVKMAYLCNNGDCEVPLWGTFSLDSIWTKLRGSSTLLHGLTDK